MCAGRRCRARNCARTQAGWARDRTNQCARSGWRWLLSHLRFSAMATMESRLTGVGSGRVGCASSSSSGAAGSSLCRAISPVKAVRRVDGGRTGRLGSRRGWTHGCREADDTWQVWVTWHTGCDVAQVCVHSCVTVTRCRQRLSDTTRISYPAAPLSPPLSLRPPHHTVIRL